jgi:thiol-disulfide isomerase/thioredoxin
MVKRVVPGFVGAVLAAAIGWLGLQYWGAGTPPWADPAGESAVPPLSGTVGNFTPTIPGRPAPIEPFYDADGHEVTLQEFGGKVVLLNLWATWCGPCAEELPSLDRLQAQLGGDRFTVLALSIDRHGAAAVQPFFKTLNITHLGIYVDPKSAFPQALDLQGLPTTLVISPTGIVLGRLAGTAKWDSLEAKALVRYYLDRMGAGLATDS